MLSSTHRDKDGQVCELIVWEHRSSGGGGVRGSVAGGEGWGGVMRGRGKNKVAQRAVLLLPLLLLSPAVACVHGASDPW